MMNRDLVFLVVLTSVGAAWLTVHLAILFWVLFSKRIPWMPKGLALIPIATPFVYWRYRGYVFPILWVWLSVGYGTLRLLFGE